MMLPVTPYLQTAAKKSTLMMKTNAVMPPAMRYTIVSWGITPATSATPLLLTLRPLTRVEEEEPLTTLWGTWEGWEFHST